MNKKLIIIAGAGGLLIFAAMFTFAWFTKPSPASAQGEAASASPEVVQVTSSAEENILTIPQPETASESTFGTIDSKMKRAMTEKQLKSLIYEVREKIQEYDNKLEGLKLREQRLQAAGETLKKDIEQLDNLRIELASTVAYLKTEQEKLLKSRVDIAEKEKANLMSIAATYDKMDPDNAGKILTNISQAKNNSSDDAIKILHYMSERTKAKVLASIAETEPAISAYFCQKLKQITEKE